MNWLIKSHTHGNSEFDGDVVISEVTKESIPSVCIRFRKDSHTKFLHNNLYLMFAIEDNKMYFQEASSKYGWKLSQSGCNKFFKLYKKYLPLEAENYGEYNLEWDAKLNLVYIDFDHKLTNNLNWSRKRGF